MKRSKVPQHKHTSYEDRLEELEKQARNVAACLQKRPGPILTIYSADSEVCVDREYNKWHKIVCKYNGDVCIGTPRPHWFSQWEMRTDGFSLIGFLNEKWEGWHGQYEKSELRYDEIPKDLLKLHIEALSKYIKELKYWLPCHIYNDLTDDLYRP